MRIEQHGRGLPDPYKLLRVHDESAKQAMRDAGQASATVLQSAAPTGRTRKLRSSIGARLGKTASGWSVVVGVKVRGQIHDKGVTNAQVMRWVNRGTGLFRNTPGPKRRIRSRRPMPLGGRAVWTVAGQKPNPFIARSRDRASLAAETSLRASHAETARKIRSM